MASALMGGCLGLMATVAAAQIVPQQTPITRSSDGYWERTDGSETPLPAGARLTISAAGHVVVRGGDGDRLKFQFTQRVRARSAERAARLMGEMAISSRSVGVETLLELIPNSAVNVQTELEITVPRKLAGLAVENLLGAVEIYDIDAPVRADTAGGPIRADRITGSLMSRTGMGEIRMGQILGTVICSTGGGSVYLERSGGEANCATAGGDIVVGRTGGPLIASTEGGSIRVEYAAGYVRAHAVAGVIQVDKARGTVFADANGGSIQVGEATGVKAESASGMVRLHSVSGPLTVSTAIGNILAELLAGVGLADSSLFTGDGDITVEIPRDLGISVRAVNSSGLRPRIVSDFPEIRVNSLGFRPPGGEAVNGALNGGGPVLNLDASGGTIYLRRTSR